MSGMGSAVSLAIEGTMTYADNGVTDEVEPINWQASSNTFIQHQLSTSGTGTGQVKMFQKDGTQSSVQGADNQYAPGIDVPFSWVSAHTATDLDGASDGVSTSSASPSSLPALATTDLVIGSIIMGNIKRVRMWNEFLDEEARITVTGGTYTPPVGGVFPFTFPITLS